MLKIPTPLFEADQWAKMKGPIVLTPMEKALVCGDLNELLKILVLAEKNRASMGDLLRAKSVLDDLRNR